MAAAEKMFSFLTIVFLWHVAKGKLIRRKLSIRWRKG